MSDSNHSTRNHIVIPAILFLCFSPIFQLPVGAGEFLLRDGDKPIVFLGDSITQQHMYTTYIETYVLTRFPNWNVTFRNVGWGGDVAWLARRGQFDSGLARDVLSLKPAVVTIDFGMNDARGGDRNLPKYIKYQKKLVEKISALGSRVILISPSPEERDQKNQPAGSAYNHMLWKYTQALHKIAKQYNVPFIDQYTPFVKVIEEGRRAKLKNFILIPGGVHPNWAGHLVMAWAILRGMHAPAEVSSLEINVKGKKVVSATNCKVKDLKIDGGGVSFVRIDNALPWPIPQAGRFVLKVPDFDPIQDLSRYMLTVKGLNPGGSYELKIDGQPSAKFTAGQLSKGVNLTLQAGPITKQALLVRQEVINKNRIFFNSWRHVKLYHLPRWLNTPQTRALKQKELDRLAKELKNAEARINATRAPKPHRFEIIPI